jgi:hypothetical protein
VSDLGVGVRSGDTVMVCVVEASSGYCVVAVGVGDIRTWSLWEMGRPKLPSLLEVV